MGVCTRHPRGLSLKIYRRIAKIRSPLLTRITEVRSPDLGISEIRTPDLRIAKVRPALDGTGP